MAKAREIRVCPIAVQKARHIVRCLHYSHKVDPRSVLHFGVFLRGRCGGAMQFGPPIDKRRALRIVSQTPWNGMLELNRLAFAAWLPRNSESRALGYALRWIRRTYPWVEWVQSYADATQSGDGTIYRAAGFSLIQIKKNTSLYRMPDGEVCCNIVFNPGFSANAGSRSVKARYGKTGSESSTTFLKKIGAVRLDGFQLRYIYFLHGGARNRLVMPVLPFSEIARRGASMYLGRSRGRSADSGTPASSRRGRRTSDPSALRSEAASPSEVRKKARR